MDNKICNPLEIIQGNVSQKDLELINNYVKLVLHWNKSINITSKNTSKERIYDFVCEGVAISRLINNNKKIVADIGSGGGFPGIILSILGHKVRLIEINSKKASFLQYVVAELELDSEVYNSDVKSLVFDDVDFVTSKAVTTTENILDLSKNIRNKSTKLILCKMENYTRTVRLTAKSGYRDYFFVDF
jgi:16S rRNA (guanine(527)-N(7))-methyltransferase RsmG